MEIGKVGYSEELYVMAKVTFNMIIYKAIGQLLL